MGLSATEITLVIVQQESTEPGDKDGTENQSMVSADRLTGLGVQMGGRRAGGRKAGGDTETQTAAGSSPALALQASESSSHLKHC